MEELTCGICNEHLGWISDNAPRGFVRCDQCHQEELNTDWDEDE